MDQHVLHWPYMKKKQKTFSDHRFAGQKVYTHYKIGPPWLWTKKKYYSTTITESMRVKFSL